MAREAAQGELQQALAAKERDAQKYPGVIAKLEANVRAERQKAAAAESRLQEDRRWVKKSLGGCCVHLTCPKQLGAHVQHACHTIPKLRATRKTSSYIRAVRYE